MKIPRIHGRLAALALAALTAVPLAAAALAPPAAAGAADPIRGEVRVENAEIEIRADGLLELFGAMRGGEHRIHFVFDGPPAEFTFVTTVRRGGEVIGRAERPPLPYFPGDMLMCPEAWDIVSLLPYEGETGAGFGHLAPGDYEIRLDAVPTHPEVRASARMDPGVIRLHVRP